VILDPHWLAGFVDAEANFCVVRKHATHRSGYQVLLSFTLTQHSRDLDLMLKIKKYLGCGNINIQPEISIVRLNITKMSDI